MEREEMQTDIILHNSILTAAARCHWPEALADLRSKGLQPDEVTHGLLVKAAGEGRWPAAQAALAEGLPSTTRSVVSFGAAMSAAERQSAWEQVEDLHLKLQSQGVFPTL
ncbi:unnamed protein product [Durusdinium trenchii]|uniref:Uncharacterized protein n=1 Tax=Durusdinium trenchii TaxID=1381693 RepID=A0ABP0LVS6_9DINO